MMRETLETTYADLRPTDLVIDKSGQAWPVGELADHPVSNLIAFWLLDPVTKVKMHHMMKTGSDAVKVSRLPTQADEAAKLEAEFPTQPDSFATMAEAVAAVEEIGGTVEAEVTADEVDAAAAATEDSPVQLPAFDSMTILEMRSHLYLLHGVFAHDMKSRDETVRMHTQAHADHDSGKLKSKHIPHTHEVA